MTGAGTMIGASASGAADSDSAWAAFCSSPAASSRIGLCFSNEARFWVAMGDFSKIKFFEKMKIFETIQFKMKKKLKTIEIFSGAEQSAETSGN